MDHESFRTYESELVGHDPGAHARLAELLDASEISIKRYATGGRPIPPYIAKSVRAMVLLSRRNMLNKLWEIPDMVSG